MVLGLDRCPVGPYGLRAAELAFLTSPLSSQAAGDTPTTPKHPKDSRENFFPAAVAPTPPDSVPADALQRPSDTHTKPRPAPTATTAGITCPSSASVSTPDPSKDPESPRPHGPEVTPSMASLGPGESYPVHLGCEAWLSQSLAQALAVSWHQVLLLAWRMWVGGGRGGQDSLQPGDPEEHFTEVRVGVGQPCWSAHQPLAPVGTSCTHHCLKPTFWCLSLPISKKWMMKPPPHTQMWPEGREGGREHGHPMGVPRPLISPPSEP